MAGNNVSICVVICTFKREQYVLKNLETLRTCKDIFAHVIVVDNAKTLDTNLADDYIEIIPNRNLGGSGGFTRGLMEAHRQGYSHVLLMDDDISFERDAYEKAKKALEALPKERKDDWIGFAMHPLNHPNIQYEMGSKWNGVKMMLNNHNLDMDDPKSDERNKKHQVYNYSAWWSLIMPTSVVDRYGLPLPFFIKFDDIEYGLRRQGERILFSSDFKVWHEDFKAKFNPYLEYYLCRNAVITNALHIKGALFKSLLRYHWKTLKFLLKGQIIEMHLASLGIRDFLIGPSVLIDKDIVEKNGEVREIAGQKIKKFPKAFAYLWECFLLTFRFLFTHHKAKKMWKEKYPYLTSHEFWERTFAGE